jgi:hypothetical protein
MNNFINSIQFSLDFIKKEVEKIKCKHYVRVCENDKKPMCIKCGKYFPKHEK